MQLSWEQFPPPHQFDPLMSFLTPSPLCMLFIQHIFNFTLFDVFIIIIIIIIMHSSLLMYIVGILIALLLWKLLAF
jgi:hypothetical protein